MASVYLTTTNTTATAEDWWTNFFRLKRSAVACSVPAHHLVASPEEAEIILFTDSSSNTQSDVRCHSVTKRFGEKVFIYSVSDREVPLLPGVYTCAEKRWYAPWHMRAGFYLNVIDHDWIQPSPMEERPPYLFSFCGSFDTHPLRRQLAGMSGARGFVRDASNDDGRGFGRPEKVYQDWHAEYAQIMRNSMFVLCPRGAAPSSHRIFETMKAGRVPVIIADQWVPPLGPNWAEFSLRIFEKNLQDIPKILDELSDRAAEMGLRASQAWERWFSKEKAFDTIITYCLGIKEARRNRVSWRPYQQFFQLARPHFFRHVVVRAAKSRLRRR